MIDYLRESFSYFGLFRRLRASEKYTAAQRVNFGPDKEQYFLYYEPADPVSDKIIYWVHGGGWNAGDPEFFDYVGQYVSKAGYRIISGGYRLSTTDKYPAQIEDVCACYNKAIEFLKEKNIDTSRIVVAGPSAGAHLTSIMCYSGKVQKEYNVDISSVIGYVGFGGPYSFRSNQSMTLSILLKRLFDNGYDKKEAEPVSTMTSNHIPMLLIQSKHDGIVLYECAEDFAARARELGNKCEIYSVEDKKNTHSWYTAGLFLETRADNKALDKFYSWIEAL